MLAMFALFLLFPAVLPRFGHLPRRRGDDLGDLHLGYNLLLGYTGLPAFGHGAFFGIGGYVLGVTEKWVTGGLALPLLAATVGTLLAGRGRCVFVARRRGIYFSLLTIAFGVMFWFMVFVFDEWTGGEDGLTGINRLSVLGYALRDNVPFYYFVYAWFVGATVLLWRIVNSPFGHVLRAIRQSETRACAVVTTRPGTSGRSSRCPAASPGWREACTRWRGLARSRSRSACPSRATLSSCA